MIFPPLPPGYQLIDNDPDIPTMIVLVGRRIELRHILEESAQGLTPAQIAQRFDLEIRIVKAGLAYYKKHQALLDAYLRAYADFTKRERERYLSQHPDLASHQERMQTLYRQRHQHEERSILIF